MSEEINQAESASDSEGLQKPVGLGLQQHPVTREMGIVLSIGDQRTWLSYKGAKQIVGEVELLITTGLAVGATMSVLSKSQPDSDLILPTR
jgi:hypothetical protein